MVVIQMIVVATETVAGSVHITMTMWECDGVERVPLAERDLWHDTRGDYGATAVIQALREAI